MAVLDDLKAVTGITDENLLNIYIRRANAAIDNYLNIDSTIDITATFPDAVIEYASECLSRKGNEGMKQFTQGNRQGTYDSGLNDDVKALLPAPFVRMMG